MWMRMSVGWLMVDGLVGGQTANRHDGNCGASDFCGKDRLVGEWQYPG